MNQLQHENSTIKSQLKAVDADIRKQKANTKVMEREIEESRRSEQELKTKVRQRGQKGKHLLEA